MQDTRGRSSNLIDRDDDEIAVQSANVGFSSCELMQPSPCEEIKEDEAKRTISGLSDAAIGKGVRMLEKRHAERRAAGRITLTDNQFLVLNEVIREYPEPVHVYGIYTALLADVTEPPTEQTVKNSLLRLQREDLIRADAVPTPSSGGAARQLFRLNSLEKANQILVRERDRLQAVIDRAAASSPTDRCVVIETESGTGGRKNDR